MHNLMSRNLECRARNAFRKAYNACPIFSITLASELEIHTADWRERVEALGFVFLRKGYFSDIYAFPKEMLK